MEDFGYTFKNKALLEIALTHPSIVVYQDGVTESYERMEFLGDSVLSCIMAEKVYQDYPSFSEGELSVALANLVKAQSIVKIAQEINIANHIEMALGEENSGGRNNPNNLENALEALIGAIFIDSNYSTVKKVVYQWWSTLFKDTKALSKKDSKSKLQEFAQKKFLVLPVYKVEEMTGADHDPTFIVSVTVNKYMLTGVGSSRKNAEQNAAKLILKKIKD